jgi:hypothetical protein
MSAIMNHPLSRRLSLTAAIALGLACFPAHAASNGAQALFKSTTRASDATLPSQAMRGSGLAGQLDQTALDKGSVAVALPDGRTLTARLQRKAVDDRRGSRSWVGTFDDEPGSVIVLTTYRNVTTGFASYGDETWEILPARNGGHMMYRVDESKFPQREEMLYVDETAADVLADSTLETSTTTAGSGGYVHDLLVVYTPASRVKRGQATLEGMIQNAVQAANQAYLNSKVGITLNLVGLQEVSYTESGDLRTSVYDLKGTTDGKMDTVHALRDKVGADMVLLVSEDTSACGIALTMRTETVSHESSAFAAVQSGCLSQHSLAHEIGHLQGNQHDRASATNVGVAPYSYGYRVCDKVDGSGWRDIMSYACSGAPRVLYFSNPGVYYNGYATGIAYESDPNNSADTARSMNMTADTVAAWRGGATTVAPSPAPAPTVPATPTSLTARASSSTSVTVTWSDASSNETGFKLERSTDGVAYTEIATLGAGSTSYSNTGLSARTNYWYRVRAYNSAGNSAYSNVSSVTTPDVAPPPPSAPTSVAAVNGGNGSATVSWVDASSNETKFEVRRETWNSKRSVWGSATAVATVTSGITSIVDLSGTGTFRYSVRAVNGGGSSAYAGPAAVTVTGSSAKGKGKNR